jgi:hypothetical protein
VVAPARHDDWLVAVVALRLLAAGAVLLAAALATAEELVPPSALELPEIAPPEGVAFDRAVEVTVRLRVGGYGSVAGVEL